MIAFLQWWPNWWIKAISLIWRTSCCGSTSITTTKTLDVPCVCVCERTLRTSCFRMCVYRQSCLMNSNQVVRWRFNPQKLNDVMCKIKYFIFRLLSHDSYVRNGHKALLKSFTFWKDDTWAESDSPITAAHHVDEWFYFSAYIMLKLIAG